MELTLTRPDVVTPVRSDPTGARGPTPRQARGRQWRTSSPGLFVPAGLERSTSQRIVEAVAGLPEGTAVTGWAALHWQHARWFDGSGPGGDPLPVAVAIDDHRSLVARPGVQIASDWLFASDIVIADGLPVTRPTRSVTFEVRRAATLERAVRIIDMAAADDLVSVRELRDDTTRLTARPGVVRLREALDLADENAWSPLEVTMRLLWHGRGHGRPRCNQPVFDLTGRHLLTPDLIDPVAAVAGEYNGASHLGDGPVRRDLDREELYRDLDIELVVTASPDLRDISAFERRLDAAYRRAGERSGPRRWTVEPPAWWVDTSSVEARRALDERARSTWLRHRRHP